MSDELTVQELEEKQKEVFEQRKTYEAAKKQSNEEHATLKKLEAAHVERLETLGKNSYRADSGLFSFRYTEAWKLGATLEERKEFFDYLKERELFDSMISINSRTLNTYAKKEAEVAESNGELDFQLPGLYKSDPVATVSLRKT